MGEPPVRRLPRAQRQAKGINLVPLVKLLASHKKAWSKDDLSLGAKEIIQQRVIASAWYPFEPFEEILCLVHEALFDASEDAAVNMGIMGGTQTFEGVHKSFVHPGQAARTLGGFGRMWERYFNFASAHVEPTDRGADLVVVDYPDMGLCHGHIIVGYGLALLKLTGTTGRSFTVSDAPWIEGDVLRVSFTFSE